MQLVVELLVADHDLRAEVGHVAVAGAVDHRDRPHELTAVGDCRNDLERRRMTDRAQRRITRRLGERDDQLLTFEVDRNRDVLTGELGRQRLGSVLVDRRLEKVDEPHPHLLGERGREVLAPDEGQPQQHGRQGFVLALRLLDCLLEVVSREHVSVDEGLAESSRLVGQHGVVPSEALG